MCSWWDGYGSVVWAGRIGVRTGLKSQGIDVISTLQSKQEVARVARQEQSLDVVGSGLWKWALNSRGPRRMGPRGLGW